MRKLAVKHSGRNLNVNTVFTPVSRITETHDGTLRGGVSRCLEIRGAAFSQCLQGFPLFMNRTPLIPSFSPSGGEGARRAVEGDSDRFMVPMHSEKRNGAFHEPQDASPANEQGTHLGFMVPMHASAATSLTGC